MSGKCGLGFYPLKCALGWDFYDRLWGTMLLPLFLAALCLLAPGYVRNADKCALCPPTWLSLDHPVPPLTGGVHL